MTELTIHALILCNLWFANRNRRKQTKQCSVRTEESAERTSREYRHEQECHTKEDKPYISTKSEDTDEGVKLANDETTVGKGKKQGKTRQ